MGTNFKEKQKKKKKTHESHNVRFHILKNSHHIIYKVTSIKQNDWR
jgi:hypothetical protein